MNFVQYTNEFKDAYEKFNARLKEGGEIHTIPFPEETPAPIPDAPYTSYFLATDDANVHGIYSLRHIPYRISGREDVTLAFLGAPLSEGLVNKTYASLGLRLLFDAVARHPMLFAIGMGGLGTKLPQLLKGLKWKLWALPFYFYVCHPGPFLRQALILRKTPVRRILLDLLSYTGAGWVAIKALQCFRGRKAPGDPKFRVELVEDFAPWVDELWDRCAPHYGLCAVRTCKMLQAIYPRQTEGFLRLKVVDGETAVGYAVVVDAKPRNQSYFGDLRLGAIIDVFGGQNHVAGIVRAVRGFLARRGVDLILTNQSHKAWCEAFNLNGFLRGPSNFALGLAKPLTTRLEKAKVADEDIHMTRSDGHIPRPQI